jgi:hypothetical protein
MTPLRGDQPVARPLPTYKQNKWEQTPMPRTGFEPTIPVFEQPKTFHAIEGAANVNGFDMISNILFLITFPPSSRVYVVSWNNLKINNLWNIIMRYSALNDSFIAYSKPQKLVKEVVVTYSRYYFRTSPEGGWVRIGGHQTERRKRYLPNAHEGYSFI